MGIQGESKVRKLLPLIGTPSGSHPGGRSAMTCRFRCGDACFHEVPNTSSNEYVGDVIAGALSRRSMMRAAAVVTVAAAGAGAVGVAQAPQAGAAPAGAVPADAAAEAARRKHKGARGLRFAPVAPNTTDAVTVPEGYRQNVVIRWGEPILRGAPAFDPEKQTAKAQAGQFGYNCDFLALLPLPGERNRQLLVANHEYTDEVLMFRGYDAANPTREQAEIAWAAHGLSAVVVEGDRKTGKLTPVPRHQLNRRVTATTEFRLTGPAAGSDLVKTSADPTGTKVLGTLNNCAGGTTPWGTTLHGELQPVLRQQQPGDRQAVRHRDRGQRAEVGAVRQAVRRRPGAERGAPLRIRRGTRPVRPDLHAPQAHRSRPLQARGRDRPAHGGRSSRRLQR
jgi:secreted PhoX family phosphatase